MGGGLAGVHRGLITVAQHDHVLHVPVSIGPLVLRVALLIAVPTVAGFAVLRAFLAEPSRVLAVSVAGTAAGAVLLELLLAGRLDLPEQAVVPILAALAGPMYLILSRNPRFSAVRRVLRGFAPLVVSVAGVLAFVEFARAVPPLARGSAGTLALLHSGVVIALVGLSWCTVCSPAGRPLRVLVWIEATLLANVALAASAYTLAITLPSVTVPT